MDLAYVLNGKVRRMSHVTRYSSFPVHHQENVAEHSWWVAFISYLIGTELYANGADIDLGVLMSRAIMHDLSECASGDIIRSYKHSSDEMLAATETADRINMQEITSKMGGGGVGASVYYCWDHAKDLDLEGQIIRFADMVSVVIYCREEYLAGNRHILKVLEEMYKTWFHKYHDDEVFGRYAWQLFPQRTFLSCLPGLDRDVTLTQTFVKSYPINRHPQEGQVADSVEYQKLTSLDIPRGPS